jgi:hypothetical protein
MPTFVVGGLRTLIQAGWVLLAGWAASRFGVKLPEDLPPAVDAMLIPLAVGAWASVTQWLETRGRRTAAGRVARLVARVYMLGLSRRPAYAPTKLG